MIDTTEYTHDSENNEKASKQLTKKSYLIAAGFLFAIALFFVSSIYLINFLETPPVEFPINTPITIELGTGMRDAIKQLKQEKLVRSEFILYAKMLTKYKDEQIIASTYIFDKPLNVDELAYELSKGHHNSNLVRLTLIEGETAKAIAERAASILADFNQETFINLSAGKEGTVFPDTYFVPIDYTAEELFVLTENTYTDKIASLEEEILNHPLTLQEILILASIIEREANTKESKQIVSGILQQRLAIGMALQVDASMEYILDKPLNELTAEDLKIDSPYNTYIYPGLPPTPIGNPGIEAIEAVLYPQKTDYLFYITGDDGNFYYAKNFEEHKRNISRYLR